MAQLASATLPGSAATVMIDDASGTATDFTSRINMITLSVAPNTEDDTAMSNTYTTTKAHSATLTLEIEFKGTPDNYVFTDVWATTLNDGRDVQFRPAGAGSGLPQWDVIAHSGNTPNQATRETLQTYTVSYMVNPPASGNPYSTQT